MKQIYLVHGSCSNTHDDRYYGHTEHWTLTVAYTTKALAHKKAEDCNEEFKQFTKENPDMCDGAYDFRFVAEEIILVGDDPC